MNRLISYRHLAAWTVPMFLAAWTLAGNVSPDFTPVRAELALAHGFSRGVLNLVVLPFATSFRHVPAWWFAAALGGLFALFAVPPATSDRRHVRMMWMAVQGAAATLLAAAALSPFLTSYRIVFAERTFVLACVLLAIPRAARVAGIVRVRWAFDEETTRRVGVVVVAVLGAAFYVSLMMQALGDYGGNYSGFLHVSRESVATAPFLTERPDLARSLITSDAGYDGQFMYLMAFDPLLQRFRDRVSLYRRVVDDPPYRYSRIGFSLLTRVLSGGAAERFPAVMVWLTVLAHLPLALAFAIVATRGRGSPWSGLVYLTIPGFAVSTAFALPEALAAAGLVAGFAFWQRRNLLAASLCFAASLLTRETGVLLVVVLVVATAMESRRRSAWLALAILPMIAWRAFVADRFFGEFGWHAIFTNPGDFAPPFTGLAALFKAGWTHAQAGSEVAAAVAFPVVLALALMVAVAALVSRRGPLEFAAVGYGLLAASLNYTQIWHHVPSGERGTFELFVCLLLVSFEKRPHPIWLGRAFGGVFAALVVYTFVFSPEASMSRAALLVIR